MYIKTFENFSSNTYEYKSYRLYYWSDNNSTIDVYNGDDYDEAKEEYDSFSSSDIDSDVNGEYNRFNDGYFVTVILEEKIDTYKWIGDEDIEDYPISEYYDDTNYYELIGEGEYNELESKDVETVESISNKEENILAENLESEIISYIKSITTENKYAAFLHSTFYALKNYKDGYIMLRVADHFFNISNVNLGKDVLYDYIEYQSKYNKYKNIYGFISINILKSDSNDKHGFRSKFREWKEYNSDMKYLVDYIDIEVNNYNDDWKDELDNKIEEMEESIDDATKSGIFVDE